MLRNLSEFLGCSCCISHITDFDLNAWLYPNSTVTPPASIIHEPRTTTISATPLSVKNLRRQGTVEPLETMPSCFNIKSCPENIESMTCPADKDAVFWKALLNHKLGKKKPKKKHTKLTNAHELAEKHGINKKDVERVYNIFVAMDDDDSGTISASEVAAMLMGFGCDVSPKVVQAVMRTSDVNGDGEINFDEFLAAVTSKVKANNNADIDVVFERLNEHEHMSAEDLVVSWKQNLAHKASAIIASVEGKTHHHSDKHHHENGSTSSSAPVKPPRTPLTSQPIVDALCDKFVTMSQTV
ncbi:hypothetical protein PRIPAC_92044 [Pristionchus pacificus]|uniref:EF-hand domain-containing protein n=1 Tax=Pristionchus pacificus TaxID=54126 RepID=A0A8R1V3V6_PRIPA|nr:hypothetical protein PRIPAC_92044 [Pristionchus pacificus]